VLASCRRVDEQEPEDTVAHRTGYSAWLMLALTLKVRPEEDFT